MGCLEGGVRSCAIAIWRFEKFQDLQSSIVDFLTKMKAS